MILKASLNKALHFNAVQDVKLEAGDGESNVRQFEMVAYSGGKLFVDGFPAPVVVDLGGVTIKAANGGDQNVPVTLDHDDKKRVGHTDTVKVGFNQIVMAGTTSAETESRDEVVNSVRSGYKWAASIEGHVRESQFIKAGQSRVVNGQRHEGPFIHAKRFVLRKVSFVTSGGDEDNVVQLAAESGEVEMDPKFKAWLEAKTFDPVAVEANETQCQYLMAQWKSETKLEPKPEPKVTTPDNDDIIDVAEQMRLKAAEAAEKIAAVETACNGDKVLFAEAMKKNWSPVEAELALLRKEREASTPAIHVSEKASDGKVIEAALLASCGKLREKDYSEDILEQSDDYKGMGLHALMHHCIRAAGKSYRPGVYDNGFIRAAYDADRELKAAGEGFSTLSMSGILSNIANKSLLSSYENVEGVMQMICGNRSVNDFKTVTMYRFIGGGKLLPLGPDGEIKRTEFDEESYTNQVETYARGCALTREMQINDDLGAFMQIPSSFGRQAALTLEKTGFEVLLSAIDGSAFFTSARGNLVETDVVLDLDGLTEAQLLWDEQVDSNVKAQDGQTVGDPVMLRGQYLLVPPALIIRARQYMNDTTLIVGDRDTTANTGPANLIPQSNPFAGSYTPLTSPYFGTKHSLTGGLQTHWLIIANPGDSPLIECARLRGQTAPVLESAETDFNTLGMQWRTYMDFGYAMQDYRAGVYSPGV